MSEPDPGARPRAHGSLRVQADAAEALHALHATKRGTLPPLGHA
ncbi:MAG: hypothetical protein RIB77_21845 [Sandaracinaceae bacterium]